MVPESNRVMGYVAEVTHFSRRSEYLTTEERMISGSAVKKVDTMRVGEVAAAVIKNGSQRCSLVRIGPAQT